MKTNQAGLDLIKKWEGFRGNSYLCPAGVWTIGYGHTSAAGGLQVRAGQNISETKAEQMLADDLGQYERGVERALQKPVNANQFAACVSLCYNIGVGAFGGSSVARYINRGDYETAAKKFALWNKADGRVLKGLVRRRRDECRLFETPSNETASVASHVQGAAEDHLPLRFNTRGRTVEELQKTLNRKGYHCGRVDGHFGKETRRAVLGMKADNGMPTDSEEITLAQARDECGDRPVSEARATASEEEVCAISTTAGEAKKAVNGAKAKFAVAVTTTAAALGIESPSDALDAAEKGRDVVGRWTDGFLDLQTVIMLLGFAGMGFALYSMTRANEAKLQRIQDYQTGKNLGH